MESSGIDVVQLDRYLTDMYGERCADFVFGCACCMAWHARDILLYGVDAVYPYEFVNDSEHGATIIYKESHL